MKIKIYQPYYEHNQLYFLDKEFEPLDNIENSVPHLREYPINLRCRELAIEEGIDLWGSFSWRWKEKLPGYTARDVIDRIENNPGYDVYFFNGFLDQVVRSYNVWEQGAKYHQYIVKIMEEALPLMGVDQTVVYQPMGRKVAFFACYCVGNKKFWDGYFELVNRFISIMPKLSDQVQNMLCGPSNYSRDPNLWYFPFIQERLFSTHLLLNQQDLKILPYHHNEKQYMSEYGYGLDLKDRAIEQKDINLLYEWRLYRNTQTDQHIDFCYPWIPYFNKNI